MKVARLLNYNFLAVTLLISLFAVILPVPAANAGPAAPEATTPGEILVGFHPESAFAQQIHELAVEEKVVAQLPNLTISLLQLPAERATTIMQQLRNDPAVNFVEPNGLMTGLWTPNDPYYNDPTKVYAPQQIKANLAWDLVRGSADVLVAVVDSGANLTHPDLAGIFWTNPGELPANGVDDDGNGYVDDVSGWDFVNGDNQPVDDLGHGTHVTGIVAAQTDNGIGIAGIAGGVKVLPVKVLNSNNAGTWANVALGIIYAADQGARIINLSLGGTTSSATVESAIQYAQSRGALVFAAAGNSASNQPFYPAAYPGVLGVAATQPNNVRWSLSNYGSFVDLAAPGASIYSTYWSTTAGSTYQFMSGTSMAAPTAAGVAALLWSLNPALSATQIADIMTGTATDLGTAGRDDYFGYGQVDAYQAALQVCATLPGNATINGMVWVDRNGNGVHDLNETQGIGGVMVQLYNELGAVIGETTSNEAGDYFFTALPNGNYTVKAATPAGYVGTTATQRTVNLGSGQATQTDFGFISPTAVRLQSLTATDLQGRTQLTWQVSAAETESAWQVLRSDSASGTPKRITANPVFGAWDGVGSLTFQFVDGDVLPGQTYWYWVQEVQGGETYGPVTAIVGRTGGRSVTFLPSVMR